jgi:aminoglycoside phosphotransferase (APT) family kinase protein
VIVPIDEALVRQLLAEQFPQWAELPIVAAEPQGWDNRTFRLGTTMAVRLPSAAGYVAQVEKEQRWLPWLAPQLPLPIPAPIALGVPGAGYPFPWSINRWIEGEAARLDRIDNLHTFAIDLAQFLLALQRIDASAGPAAGPHSFYRGAPLNVYDAETRQALTVLAGIIDTAAATALWERAVQTHWQQPPVWFQGDVAVGNLLVRGGRLCAVIDFGTSGVGDPACDTVIAWTLLSGKSRAAFKATLALDEATWLRGRGWALWKALITLAEYRLSDSIKADDAYRVIEAVLEDDGRW